MVVNEYAGWVNGIRVIRKDLTQQELDSLFASLSHQKFTVRWTTADRLGKIGDRRAVDPLVVALQDPHWLVRLHAAKALGRIGDSRAISSLIDALHDQNPSVRRRATVALGRFDNERAVQNLIVALDDPDKWVRAYAVESLAKHVTPPIVVLIASAVRDPASDVSWAAVAALVGIGAPAVEPVLALLSDADEEVRRRAIGVLEIISDDDHVVNAIRPFLEDANEKLRWTALVALRRMNRRRPRNHLNLPPPSAFRRGQS